MSVANILEALDIEIANLTQARTVLTGLNGSTVKVTAVKATGRRVVSAASRRKMAAAQKARWAKVRSLKPSAKPNRNKSTRVMSISARRKIAAAQKARWAKVRAHKKAA
jgi:hypothetical protein